MTGERTTVLFGLCVAALVLCCSCEGRAPDARLLTWLHLHYTEVRRNPSVFDVATPTLDSDERRAAYRAIAASKSERAPSAGLATVALATGEKISCANVTLEGGANEGTKLGVVIRQSKPDPKGESLWQIQAMSTTRACTCNAADCSLR